MENRSRYDIKGVSTVNNDSFDHEIIVADLDGEHVYHFGLPLFGKGDAGKLKGERGA